MVSAWEGGGARQGLKLGTWHHWAAAVSRRLHCSCPRPGSWRSTPHPLCAAATGHPRTAHLCLGRCWPLAADGIHDWRVHLHARLVAGLARAPVPLRACVAAHHACACAWPARRRLGVQGRRDAPRRRVHQHHTYNAGLKRLHGVHGRGGARRGGRSAILLLLGRPESAPRRSLRQWRGPACRHWRRPGSWSAVQQPAQPAGVVGAAAGSARAARRCCSAGGHAHAAAALMLLLLLRWIT